MLGVNKGTGQATRVGRWLLLMLVAWAEVQQQLTGVTRSVISVRAACIDSAAEPRARWRAKTTPLHMSACFSRAPVSTKGVVVVVLDAAGDRRAAVVRSVYSVNNTVTVCLTFIVCRSCCCSVERPRRLWSGAALCVH